MTDSIGTNYLTVDDLCRFLKVKRHYIYELTYQRRIPFVKLGRFLRFDEQEIKKWLKDKAVPTENVAVTSLAEKDGIHIQKG